MRFYVSCARGFDPSIPVHLWTRFAFRADLAKHMAFKQLAVSLIVRHARKCGVDLHAVAVLDNHVHLIASQRGKVRWEDRWRRGISPFMRNWKSELSYHLRLLGLAGSKFEARFRSINLLSWEQYVTKYAYVVGQAVRHRAREEDVVITRAILDGDVDGIASVIPAIFADGDRRLAARRFGALVRDVIENARLLATGQELEVRPGLAAERRRQERRELVRRRESHEEFDRHQRRLRAMVSEDWWEAAQVAMWNHGVEVSDRPLQWFSAASVPGGWAACARRWVRFRLPELTVVHQRDAANRVHRSRVSGGGSDVWIAWPLRMDDPP